MSFSFRPTKAIVRLDHLRFNIKQLQSLLPVGQEMIGIVKANAYGHGSVMVSRVLESTGVKRLAVATLEEALILRQQGLHGEIHVLDGVMGDPAEFLDNRCYPVIHRSADIDLIKKYVAEEGRPFFASLKFDTGMGRLGFLPDQLDDVLVQLAKIPQLSIVWVLTHLAQADTPDQAITQKQYLQFAQIRQKIKESGATCFKNSQFSIANSAALLDGLCEDYQLARPGIALYGAYPHERQQASLPLKPVLSFETEILSLKKFPKGSLVGYGGTFCTQRDTIAAILPVGYADGYPRLLSNKGHVLIDGQKAPLIGRISMDLAVVDVTNIFSAQVGSRVVLIGQDGDLTITAEQVAAWAQTISYEVLTGITARVPRVYRDI